MTDTHTPIPTPEAPETVTLSPSVTQIVTISPLPTGETTVTALPETEVTSEPTATDSASPIQPPTITPTEPVIPPEPSLVEYFTDEFETASTVNWQLGSGWSIGFVGDLQALQSNNTIEEARLKLNPLFNMAMEMRFQLETGSLSVETRHTSAGEYTVTLDSSGEISLYRSSMLMQQHSVPLALDDWHTLRIGTFGGDVGVQLNGTTIMVLRDPEPLPPGAIILVGSGNGRVAIDSIAVWLPADEVPTLSPTPSVELTPTIDASVTPANLVSRIQTATTFVVNSVDDNDDTLCDVSHCSLREAINAANANTGVDAIRFNIAGSPPYLIQPLTGLPLITDTVIIDGTTEPDFSDSPVIVISGSNALPDGLVIAANNTTIRGLTLNGFTNAAIYLLTGVETTIAGNFIGTDSSGSSVVGNGYGIYLEPQAVNNIIGGTNADDANVVSGNQIGMWVASRGNFIIGNFIGTDKTATIDLGNTVGGIRILNTQAIPSATPATNANNIIGGTASGTSNVIAYNAGYGVAVENGSFENKILGNRIFGNTVGSASGLGIDLIQAGEVFGVDDDTYMDITSAYAMDDQLIISGEVDITIPVSRSATVELFLNNACDPSGYGEGEIYLTTLNLTTDNNGFIAFNTTIPISATVGQFITATLTLNGTYEFTPCQDVQELVEATVNTTDDVDDGLCDASHCSLREAINLLNSASSSQTLTIKFDIDGPAPHIIQTSDSLPTIVNPVLIDGFSEPDYVNTPVIMLDGSAHGSDTAFHITGGNSQVRGLAIYRFTYGIHLDGNGNNEIVSNYIGLDYTGESGSYGSSFAPGAGVLITSSSNNQIGWFGARNVISGNVGAGILIENPDSIGNVIQANFIGSNASVNYGLGNEGPGIEFRNSAGNTLIGGPAYNDGNVIVGNVGPGITNQNDFSGTSDNNIIQGNAIGTSPDFYITLGNQAGGIILNGSNNVIGIDPEVIFSGGLPITANLIANNTDVGIGILGGTGNAVGGNLIRNTIAAGSAGGGLGIDLGMDGITANDGDDADTGPNNFQNYPVIEHLVARNSTLSIYGSLDGMPDQEYLFYFFNNETCDPSGYGEGRNLNGMLRASTDGDGHLDLVHSLYSPPDEFPYISVVATNLSTHDTSEYSLCYHIDTVLNAPSSLSLATNGSAQIDLEWTDNAINETNYRIERREDSGDPVEIAVVPADTTTYSDTDSIKCGHRYEYRVRAYYAATDTYSSYSGHSSIVAELCPPTNLTASPFIEAGVQLEWEDNSGDETRFFIERSPDGINDWAQIGFIASNNSTYIDTTFSCNQTGFFRVRAYRSSDSTYSKYSNIVEFTSINCTPQTGTEFLVTDFDDSYDGVCTTFHCTLREAIRAANAHPGQDTIPLPAGTFTLMRRGDREDVGRVGDLDITDDLIITGAGPEITLVHASFDEPGGGYDRALDVDPLATGITVEIRGMTIYGATVSFEGGAGVRNQGDLILNEVTIRDHRTTSSTGHGAGILNTGNLEIIDSTLTNNEARGQGGAIYNDTTGTILISGSTLANNRAVNSTSGGAISNHGTITITNSTLSGNGSSVHGGAAINAGVLLLNNVTVAGNHADAFSDNYNGGNGGAFYLLSGSSLQVQNTIFSGNVRGIGSEPSTYYGPGTFESLGNNLFEAPYTGHTATDDLIVADALLGALADNDGPTMTHALLFGSPAIDTGNNATCELTDQRGYDRPTDGDSNGSVICDIGAFEKIDTFPLTISNVNTALDTGAGTLGQGESTAQAITSFIFTFDQEVYDPAGDSEFDDVTNLANYTLVSAGPNSHIDTVSCATEISGDDVAISVDSIVYNNSNFEGTLTVNGGIALVDADYRLIVCANIRRPNGYVLDGNDDGTGGDDFVLDFSIDTPQAGPEFTVNTTEDSQDTLCGVRHCSLREAIVNANEIAGPHTIHLPAGQYLLTLNGIEDNSSYVGDLDITDDLIIQGAAAQTTIIDGDTRTVFEIHNNAVVSFLNLSIENGLFGIRVQSNSADVTIENTNIRNNADRGIRFAGVFNATPAERPHLTMRQSLVSGNGGGGVYLYRAVGVISNSTISNNKLPLGNSNGGGIYSSSVNLTLNNVTITDNYASSGGGIEVSHVYLSNTLIAGNTSDYFGPDCRGYVTSLGNNLIQETFGCSLPDNPTDIVGVDPLLDVLADNGGETYTHALLPGSPAIDAGEQSICEISDQRGVHRNQGASCDIGAYEYENMALPAPVNLLALAQESTRIELTWVDNSAGESDFRIERSNNGGADWSEIAIVPAETEAYTDEAITCAVSYSYRVRAYRESDTLFSNYSDTASATIFDCAPQAGPVFTVNTTDDMGDLICGPVHCSLRDAIYAANNATGSNLILFSIAGDTPHIIQLRTELPVLTGTVIIDGRSEPDYVNAPVVMIDGSLLAGNTTGFTLQAANSGIHGLSVVNFYDAIVVESNGNMITANYIGIDTTGQVAPGNTRIGIYLNSDTNQIGGASPSNRNVISGNEVGIYLQSAAGDNIIQGNYIGTDASGQNALGNVTGIRLSGSDAQINTIGGTATDAGNLISGNTGDGIAIQENRVVLQGNLIGVDATGTSALPNDNGINVTSTNNSIIGGTEPGARNVISGNNGAGLSIRGGTNLDVQGNLIGTDITGQFSVANNQGIYVYANLGTVNGVVIGGPEAGARNIISGNSQYGVWVWNGTMFGLDLINNFIGVDSSGGQPLGNGIDGIRTNRPNFTVVDNVISANSRHGLVIEGPASGNIVRGNFIGTDETSSLDLGNSQDGVHIGDGVGSDAEMMVIGGTLANERNVIAYNGGNGIYLAGNEAGSSNQFRGNSIFNNAELGIDLGADGVTTNDITDSDSGPNDFQNYPIIVQAIDAGDRFIVEGVLITQASQTYTVDFYANESCDASGYGEGQTYVGSTIVNSNVNGNGTFSLRLDTVEGSPYITSTATNAAGSTSEFSACEEIVAAIDLQVILQASQSNVVPGENFTYTISLANNGFYPASDVILNSTVPDQTQLQTVETSQGTCTEEDDAVTCAIGNLAEQSTVVVTLAVEVAEDAQGALQISAQAVSGETDIEVSDNVLETSQPIELPPVPDRASLTNPAHRALLAELPQFVWSAVNYASFYQIQVDNDSRFRSPEIDLAVSPNTAFTPTALSDGRYYWRVRAINTAGIAGSWSTTWQVTLDTTAPAAPDLLRPSEGQRVSSAPNLQWRPAATATVYQLQVAASDSFASVLVDVERSGRSYRVPVASLAQGTYFWRVRARDAAGNWGAFSPVWHFTFGLQQRPADGGFTTDTTPVFTWGSLSGAAAYEFQLDDASDFTSVDVSVATTGRRHTLSSVEALAPGVYYWRINVDRGSGFEISPVAFQLIITPRLPSRPVLVSPAHRSLTGSPHLSLEWLPVIGDGSPFTYQLQVDDDSRFRSPQVDAITADSLYETAALADGRYYWRVRAINNYGATTAWSVSRYFTIDTTAPAAPDLLRPSEGQRMSSAPNLQWRPAATATVYQLQVAASDSFASVLIDVERTGRSYRVPVASLAQGTYFWRVRARDAAGNWGAFGPVWHFTFGLQQRPADGGFTTDTTPVFTWGSLSGAAAYEFQLDDASDFTSVDVSVATTGRRHTLSSVEALVPGVYYWRINVDRGSGFETSPVAFQIIITPHLPSATVLISPPHQANISDDTPQFGWQSSPGDMGMPFKYEINIASNSRFRDPEVVATVDGTTYIAPSLEDGRYYWRVRTLNYLGVPGKWSRAYWFDLDATTDSASGDP